MAHFLVRVLKVTDPSAAEQQARALLVAARAQHDYRMASAAAGDLIRYSLDGGRLAEARDLAGQNIRYKQQTHLGPWTQLLGEVQRLRVQRGMGRAGQVFAEVLRPTAARPATIPARTDTNRAHSRSDTIDLNEATQACRHVPS